MNPQILNLLKENRSEVDSTYNKMVELANRRGFHYITNKKFFFQIVFDYFEKISKIKINRCLNNEMYFLGEFRLAIEKAEYACAKPTRQDFINERFTESERLAMGLQ